MRCSEVKIGLERGAAAVELAVSIVGLLILVALIVDGSLLFHRYTLLNETGAEMARKISSNVVREPIPPAEAGLEACKTLCERAKAEIQASPRNELFEGDPFNATIISTAVGLDPVTSYAPYPLIRIDGVTPARCLFCAIIPWEFTLHTRSLLLLESSDTGCSYPDPVECS